MTILSATAMHLIRNSLLLHGIHAMLASALLRFSLKLAIYNT